METTTFNQLFENAKQVADRRHKVFNQLIEKTCNEIMPKTLSLLESLGHSSFCISTKTQSFFGESEITLEDYEHVYAVFIDTDDGEIHEADYDITPNGEGLEYVRRSLVLGNVKDKDIYKKVGIIELVHKLQKLLTHAVEKAEAQCKEAQGLL